MLQSDEIRKQMAAVKGVYEVDMDSPLSRMKTMYTHWIISLHDKLRNSKGLTFKVFMIMKVLEKNADFRENDHLSHLL